MTEDYLNPFLPIALSWASAAQAASPSTVILTTAPEKANPGLPGKKVGELLLVRAGDIILVQVSIGNPGKYSADTFRQAGGEFGKWLRQSGADKVDLDIGQFSAFGTQGALEAFLEGTLLGAYQFNLHKKSEPASPITLYLRGVEEAWLGKLATRISGLMSAVYLARDWGHEPANIINPITLTDRLRNLANQFGLKFFALDEKELEAIGAGAIVNVGKGSQTPSRLIVLEYSGANSEEQPVVLVGKALTFDSGGYSLKGVENIVGMKYDKCGGVTVAAVLAAAATLKLKTHLVGIVGAAENMVSSKAFRPDDIITTLSGKTVEIISTDAEGRLVLADSLTYAQNTFKPRALIDLATLTGGVITALGRVRAGLMCNDEVLAQQLFSAGEKTAEKLWRLPLDDEYFNQIKGDDADIKNSGGREAHPVTGGVFLKQFVSDEVPWAHLDIAGVANIPKDTPYSPKGATGFGIRLLIEFLENL